MTADEVLRDDRVLPQLMAALHQHDHLTARYDAPLVEVCHAGTGDLAALIGWTDQDWWWCPGSGPGAGTRLLPVATTVEELVRAVATSVLDEAAKR